MSDLFYRLTISCFIDENVLFWTWMFCDWFSNSAFRVRNAPFPPQRFRNFIESVAYLVISRNLFLKHVHAVDPRYADLWWKSAWLLEVVVCHGLKFLLIEVLEPLLGRAALVIARTRWSSLTPGLKTTACKNLIILDVRITSISVAICHSSS